MISTQYSQTIDSTLSNLYKNQLDSDQLMNQLSTGFRINTASDDAAGLTQSIKIESELSGNNKALYNIEDAIGMMNKRMGLLQGMLDIGLSIRDGWIAIANETQDNRDIDELHALLRGYREEIRAMFTGNTGGRESFNSWNEVSLEFETNNRREFINIQMSGQEGDEFSIRLDSPWRAARDLYMNAMNSPRRRVTRALNFIERGMETVSRLMAQDAGTLYRLESARRGLIDKNIALTQTLGRIKDADFAQATADMASLQVKAQSTTSILSQTIGLNRLMALRLIKENGLS